MENYKHYTYRISWSDEDNEFIGLCSEFPSLSFLHKNEVKAFTGIMSLVRSVVKDMLSNGEVVPIPFSEKKYSGRILLRVLPKEHRLLSIKATEQGVSLNRYLNSKVTQ